MASPTTAAAAEVDEDNDFWMAEADAAALEAALDAYRYECAQDDPSLLELLEAPLEAGKAKAKGSGAKSAKVQGSWVTMQQRNIRFMHFFMPILKGYRRMQLLVAKMRKKDKPKDPEKYTCEKQVAVLSEAEIHGPPCETRMSSKEYLS